MADPAAPAGPAVAVACSGGRDSLALLHATVHRAAEAGLRVVALHVHHGLQPTADHWVAHLATTCRRWAARGLPVTLAVHRVEDAPPVGDSVEAWARRVRYAALVTMARRHGCGLVLLAHHRRDQAETVLLQALRGAGPAGLGAMPPARQAFAAAEIPEAREATRAGEPAHAGDPVGEDAVVFARPWLDQPRERIEAYARRHRLRWVDDPSNDDPRWARSRLRLAVWPALATAFPEAEAALARAARRQREAAEVLAEVAASDLDACRAPDGDGPTGILRLAVTTWLRLSPGRRAGVLRAWLDSLGLPVDGVLVERLLAELPTARGGARWGLPGTEAVSLRLHRGVLRAMAAESGGAGAGDGAPTVVRVDRAGIHDLPAGGRLRVTEARAGGVPWPLLAAVTVAPRSGGERFQAGPGRPARSLRKQFQAAGIPAWARGAPLLWAGDRLLFVPGLGIDARCLATPGEPQATLDWLP